MGLAVAAIFPALDVTRALLGKPRNAGNPALAFAPAVVFLPVVFTHFNIRGAACS